MVYPNVLIRFFACVSFYLLYKQLHQIISVVQCINTYFLKKVCYARNKRLKGYCLFTVWVEKQEKCKMPHEEKAIKFVMTVYFILSWETFDKNTIKMKKYIDENTYLMLQNFYYN